MDIAVYSAFDGSVKAVWFIYIVRMKLAVGFYLSDRIWSVIPILWSCSLIFGVPKTRM
jgi:hypothetical protein